MNQIILKKLKTKRYYIRSPEAFPWPCSTLEKYNIFHLYNVIILVYVDIYILAAFPINLTLPLNRVIYVCF